MKGENLRTMYAELQNNRRVVCNEKELWISYSGKRRYIHCQGIEGRISSRMSLSGLRDLLKDFCKSNNYKFTIYKY